MGPGAFLTSARSGRLETGGILRPAIDGDTSRADIRRDGRAYLATVQQLADLGALEGGVQVWVDRLALSAGAAANAVVAEHLGKEGML